MTTGQKWDGLWQGGSLKERKNMDIGDTNGKWQEDTVGDCKWAPWEKNWNMHWSETTELWDYAPRTFNIAIWSLGPQSRPRFITHPPAFHVVFSEKQQSLLWLENKPTLFFLTSSLLPKLGKKYKCKFSLCGCILTGRWYFRKSWWEYLILCFCLPIRADVPLTVLMVPLLVRASNVHL